MGLLTPGATKQGPVLCGSRSGAAPLGAFSSLEASLGGVGMSVGFWT